MNQKAYLACNFNCLIEMERLLPVTGRHIDCKCGSVSLMVRVNNVSTDQTETTNGN